MPPIEHVDLDGDGIADILALEKWAGNEPLTAPTLVAFSATSGKRLWQKKLVTFYRPMPTPATRSWPLAADLDGDGHCEIVVPDFDSVRAYTRSRSTGAFRCSMAQVVNRVLAARSGREWTTLTTASFTWS